MGCSTSKHVDSAAVAIYQSPSSSFAIFDIDTIKEPWLTFDQDSNPKPKAALFPDTIKTADVAPHSWDEVGKALENHNKPNDAVPSYNPSKSKPLPTTAAAPPTPPIRDRRSFHTLGELDKKISTPKSNLPKSTKVKKSGIPENAEVKGPDPAPTGFKSVKKNMFIVRDRLEIWKEGKTIPIKRDPPLIDFPEKCPPNGAESVVIYTTSLGGVRLTYEDCEKVKAILNEQGVIFDERDVSLHGEFWREMKGLLMGEEEATVPRVFVKGWYLGGVDKLSELSESGRLGMMMSLERIWGFNRVLH